VDERPYLVDTVPEMPTKPDDVKVPATLSDSASKPPQLSTSQMQHNVDKTTTTPSDARRKNVEVSLSETRHNVAKMTPASNNSVTAEPLPSKSHCTDSGTTVKSADKTVQSAAQQVDVVNKNNSKSTTDGVVVSVAATETQSPSVDVRTRLRKPPVGGDVMDVSESKGIVSKKSPSLCNWQLQSAARHDDTVSRTEDNKTTDRVVVSVTATEVQNPSRDVRTFLRKPPLTAEKSPLCDQQLQVQLLSVAIGYISGVFQGIPEPNRAWLLGNRSLTPVASGRPLVYQVT